MSEGGTDSVVDAARRRARTAARRRWQQKQSTEWPELAPPVAVADGPLGLVQTADREIARQTALRARAVAAFADSRPADADRAQGEPGAMSAERWAARPELLRPVSEWAAQELSVALSISMQAADTLLFRSLTLVQRLPGTLAALEARALHPGHLHALIEHVAPIEDDTLRAQVEAGLLRWAAGRVTTPAQLGDKARREVARADARAAARRLEKALRRRGVHLDSRSQDDGLAAVTVLLTEPEAQVLYRALGAYADQVPDDPANPRTRQQKMADCLMDLVLRPDGFEPAQVQVLLTVVASIGTLAGGDEVGEVNGRVVPAEMIRELLRLLGPEPTPEASQDDELAEWWAETEERVLSELVDPDPDPIPDDLQERWARSPEGIAWLTDLAHHERWSAEWDRLAYSGELALLDPERPPEPPATNEWWGEADRAVDEASEAMRRADEAIGRADRLVRAAKQADQADEADFQQGAGRFTDADDALAVLRMCTDDQRKRLTDLLLTTHGGGLVERPRIALTDALTGALLALTDLPEMRRTGQCGARACRRDPAGCAHDLTGRPGLGPPGPTDGYRPDAKLDRFLRARDRRCRQPGCRRPVPRAGELDHNRPYPDGPTSAANMNGFCTGHHRGKHQAPGWEYALAPEGTLTVTTPTGLVTATEPPPY